MRLLSARHRPGNRRLQLTTAPRASRAPLAGQGPVQDPFVVVLDGAAAVGREGLPAVLFLADDLVPQAFVEAARRGVGLVDAELRGGEAALADDVLVGADEPRAEAALISSREWWCRP